ncbi:starvation-inducible DNA-binding protein [Pseudonocardia sediminis]|uniref:Starvation-inducible DNA-binding protein n=1 Tax=Pseudonocardia sediminis TaxID=1397368 RepID=A0A4Q7UZG0_PSEST|nr:DNA starvation/stationary phase protection protein [Pseudonocardia sediminis]RZT87185.1 starvation-inducible DNA-binding protein [Pseudonocardia sediminis]
MAAPITSPLDDGARDITGRALQDTVVDLIDLSLVAKQAHWNLVGRQFRDVHLHLDELVTTARTYTDSAAERAAAIGVSPDGRSTTVAKTTGIPEFPQGWVSDRDTVVTIFEAVDAAVQRLRPRIDETDKTDPVTQDLFIEIARVLEQDRWMWQAQASGYDETA